jgi:hypothetical protein
MANPVIPSPHAPDNHPIQELTGNLDRPPAGHPPVLKNSSWQVEPDFQSHEWRDDDQNEQCKRPPKAIRPFLAHRDPFLSILVSRSRQNILRFIVSREGD